MANVDASGLAAVIDAWPDLPAAVRAGIVAMVKASRGEGLDQGGS